mgnify:CR=1 FL=1
MKETISAPFFRPVPVDVADWWLANGLRKPAGDIKGIHRFEAELIAAWRSLSQLGRVFGANELMEELDRIAGKQRKASTLSAAIVRYMVALGHAGIVLRERAGEMGPGYSRAMIYSLQAPDVVLESWRGGPRDTQDNPDVWRMTKTPSGRVAMPPQVARHERDIEATYHLLLQSQRKAVVATLDDSEEHWTLSLVTQLLERCSRPNLRDKAKAISSEVRVSGETVKVVTQAMGEQDAESGAGILAADDSQLVLAILTSAAQEITRAAAMGELPRNWLTLDLQDLCDLLLPDAGVSGLRMMQKSMARIIGTQFVLEFDQTGSLREKMSEALGGQAVDRFRFSLIEHVAEGGVKGRRHVATGASSQDMRVFAFSLHPLLWGAIQRGQGLIVHPELLFERDGIVHKVYHHLRLHAGVEQAYLVTAEDLMDALNLMRGANRRRARIEFSERLWRIMRERSARAGRLLGPELSERTHVRFFDLDLLVSPSDHHKSAIMIEAYHSEETLALMRRQEERSRELLALVGGPGAPGQQQLLL